MRGILKRAGVVCHPESEHQKKIAMDAEQDPTPHRSVSHGGSSASGTRPNITTSDDGGHPSSERSDSRRITTKRDPREVRDERASTNEQHVPRRILGKTTPREQAAAVPTQEAPARKQ